MLLKTQEGEFDVKTKMESSSGVPFLNTKLTIMEIHNMIHSFLLIGQSNMAGRGFFNETQPIQSSRIFVLRNGRWQPMFSPVNPDRPFSGVNLAESFAQKYAETHNVKVGLIPCADGGTSLNQWQPGGLLFDNAVYQAKLAQRTSTIAGVLWHQGEADCSETLYPTYEQRCTPIFDALKKELDLYDVPFLLGGLGDFLPNCTQDSNLQNYTKINEALQSMAAKDAMTGYVDASGLQSNPDNLHFCAKALREFGLRYFDVFLSLEKKDKVFTEKPNCDLANRTAMEAL